MSYYPLGQRLPYWLTSQVYKLSYYGLGGYVRMQSTAVRKAVFGPRLDWGKVREAAVCGVRDGYPLEKHWVRSDGEYWRYVNGDWVCKPKPIAPVFSRETTEPDGVWHTIRWSDASGMLHIERYQRDPDRLVKASEPQPLLA